MGHCDLALFDRRFPFATHPVMVSPGADVLVKLPLPGCDNKSGRLFSCSTYLSFKKSA
jgi:hypothetical protein